MERYAVAPIEQTVEVTYRYIVSFTEHVFDRSNDLLRQTCRPSVAGRRSKVLCVVDRGTSDANPTLMNDITAYFADAQDSLDLVSPPLVVPGGEAVKNSHESVTEIQRAIHDGQIDRHSYVVVVGGGAVLDMAGYAAATAHRGIRLVRVPTTVLAQNDSGVGVKNSVNAFGKKNFLGTFAPPFAVINDRSLLRRLPDREWLAGISEAVKVALLKDVTFFEFIEENADRLVARDEDAMEGLVYRCAQLHLEHIATSGDPFEFGSSRPLDFGHWSAHKLEQLSNYAWRHGEAVAIGISLDATYSYLKGMLSEADWRRILNVFLAVNLPIYAEELTQSLQYQDDTKNVLSGLDEFREHLGGELTIMLLNAPGRGIEVHDMDEDTVIASIARLKQEHDALVKEEPNGRARNGSMPAFPTAASR